MRKILKSKFLIYVFLVLAIVVVVDLLVSASTDSLMKNKFDRRIEAVKEGNSDIAIIGASRASHHYIPKMLEDSLHVSAFNYGIDGRNIYVHYAVLKKLLDNERKPKIVILDLSNVDVYDTPGFNLERLNILYPYYKDPTIGEILSDLLDNAEWSSIKYSGLVRHNSNFINYVKDLMKSPNDANKGYEPLSNTLNEEIKEETGSNSRIDAKKLEYLKKFIAECKKNNIRLILVSSPAYTIDRNKQWVKEIKEIAEKNQVPYLDFQDDPLFLTHKEWFSDPAHLNDKGAHEFSKLIIHEIKKSLSDNNQQ